MEGIERPGRPRGPARERWAVLVVPALVFLVVFFVAPLVMMSLRSVTDPPDAGLSNYIGFFEGNANLRALRTTFWIAFISTLACLLIGYPYAYLMTIVPGRVAGILLIAVLLPFWSSLLVQDVRMAGDPA